MSENSYFELLEEHERSIKVPTPPPSVNGYILSDDLVEMLKAGSKVRDNGVIVSLTGDVYLHGVRGYSTSEVRKRHE